MDVNIHWFNGYYNTSLKSTKEANQYFENAIKSNLDGMQCHPLVNSAWCKLIYNVDTPLKLDFARNAHEWNYLHPLFDPFWYQSHYSRQSRELIVNPYEHFLLIGHKKMYSTSPLLNAELIMKQYTEKGYLDTITQLGMEIMKDKYRRLGKISLEEFPILNAEIDWNYLIPALAWKWI